MPNKTTPKTATPSGNVSFNLVTAPEWCEPGYWLGQVEICGQHFHLELVEVDEYGQAIRGKNSNGERLLDLGHVCGDGPFVPVDWPGIKNPVILWMTPHTG